MKKKSQAVQISKKDAEHLEADKKLICRVNVIATYPGFISRISKASIRVSGIEAFLSYRKYILYDKNPPGDRTAAVRLDVAEATQPRRRIPHAGFFLILKSIISHLFPHKKRDKRHLMTNPNKNKVNIT